LINWLQLTAKSAGFGMTVAAEGDGQFDAPFWRDWRELDVDEEKQVTFKDY